MCTPRLTGKQLCRVKKKKSTWDFLPSTAKSEVSKGKDKGGKAVCGPRRENPPQPFSVGVRGKLPNADTRELTVYFFYF